jgi:DNA-binding NarL/FixJ family response regulator
VTGTNGPIRLLIADDHPVVRDGLRGIFEASGEFEVAGEAANGREAVDRAAALRPDVVLMDLRMPELDGVSAIRALAQRCRRAGTRAHHLRHRHRRAARDRGRRHRLPAEGLTA